MSRDPLIGPYGWRYAVRIRARGREAQQGLQEASGGGPQAANQPEGTRRAVPAGTRSFRDRSAAFQPWNRPAEQQRQQRPPEEVRAQGQVQSSEHDHESRSEERSIEETPNDRHDDSRPAQPR